MKINFTNWGHLLFANHMNHTLCFFATHKMSTWSQWDGTNLTNTYGSLDSHNIVKNQRIYFLRYGNKIIYTIEKILDYSCSFTQPNHSLLFSQSAMNKKHPMIHGFHNLVKSTSHFIQETFTEDELITLSDVVAGGVFAFVYHLLPL